MQSRCMTVCISSDSIITCTAVQVSAYEHLQVYTCAKMSPQHDQVTIQIHMHAHMFIITLKRTSYKENSDTVHM